MVHGLKQQTHEGLRVRDVARVQQVKTRSCGHGGEDRVGGIPNHALVVPKHRFFGQGAFWGESLSGVYDACLTKLRRDVAPTHEHGVDCVGGVGSGECCVVELGVAGGVRWKGREEGSEVYLEGGVGSGSVAWAILVKVKRVVLCVTCWKIEQGNKDDNEEGKLEVSHGCVNF